MSAKPKRVAVIGLDCAIPHLVEQHIAEGHLPTIKQLIANGVIAENCLVPFPTVTPPNWATIATGAWPGTHQVTDFHLHRPGTTPENMNTMQGFNSAYCHAEFLWDAADRAGKKCIVLNYPGSWPPKMENGIMVGGAGLTIAEYRDNLPALETEHDLCWDQLITTGIYPMSMRGTFQPAEGWMNVPDLGDAPLEMSVEMMFPRARNFPAPATWHVLVRKTTGDDYDCVTLAPTKDFAHAFCTLRLGEWSSKIVTPIKMYDDSTKQVFFRCKLIELSPEAEDFRLFITALGETSGWSAPPEIASQIVSPTGTFAPGGGIRAYTMGWIDLDTYVELNEQVSQWLADAATSLLTQRDWDVFFMHSHPPDWVYHILLTDMDPALCPDEEKRRRAWDAHLRIYQSQDQMIAQILKALDDETLVVLVSDHGAVPEGPLFDPYVPLVAAGLTTMQESVDLELAGIDKKFLKVGLQMPEVSKSKAFPQREIYVYINLKGRDPEGIVEPAEYEHLQQQIIDALITYVDPETGKRPVALALAKKDARILGLYGDQVGDVVYAVYPWFGGQHGQALPTAEWGVGGLKGLFVLNGPGIKKGARLQRTVHLTDLVPTLCYLLDLPVPEHTEGAVIYQAFQDPNFKLQNTASGTA